VIFPEFRDKIPGIPGGWQLYKGASKISMDVAEPLPSVHLDIIQEIVATLHHLTPSCTLVAPHLRWDPYLLCTLGLFPPSTSRCAAPQPPYARDAVCGHLSPHTHAHQRFITVLSWSHIVLLPEFRDLLFNLCSTAQCFAFSVRCRQ